MEGWKSKVVEIRSRCGFCEEIFQLWSDRNDHLAEHFRNGASMNNWKGARGLEPAVATLVRHSIPPYLISTESTAMIPFSAERDNSQQPITPKPHFPSTSTTPTSFEYLVSELGKYAMSQKAQNIIPTDQTLQEKARLIVYGDNDPWNQTAADNSQWLELFKEGFGFADSASTSAVQTDLSAFVAQESEFPESLDLPWYWQSPECLAIYRQNKASFYAHHSAVPVGNVYASEALPRSAGFDFPTGPVDFDLPEQEPSVSLVAGDDSTYTGQFTHNHFDLFDQFNDRSYLQPSDPSGGTELLPISNWQGQDIFPSDLELEMLQLYN